MMILYKLLLSFLVAFQVIGPSWVLAIQTSEAFQEASTSQALIAGIRGVVTVIPNDKPGYAPKYRSALALGDVISTEEESVAEILLQNQGLVTVQGYSEAMLGKDADGRLSIALEVGAAEWSIPTKNQGGVSLTFTTPNIRATTHGGLVTAEVQPTLGKIARVSRPRDSFLIRTSLHAQASSLRDVGLLETFCVNEGGLTIEYPGAQQGLWQQETVAPGECLGFLNGQPRAMGAEYRLADWRAVCSVGTHCEIPESAKKLIAKKQMGQALALEQALVGSDSEEGEVDDEVILATTAANFESLTSTSFIPPNPQSPCLIDPNSCEFPFPPDPNIGGNGPSIPKVPLPPPPGGGGGSLVPGNIQSAALLIPESGVVGGVGLLTFVEGDFTADKELLIGDSGFLAAAPHLGKAPQNSLVVKGLSPNGSGSPSNQKLPIEFGAFAFNFPDFKQDKTSDVQVGTEDVNNGLQQGFRRIQLGEIAQFARSPLIDPDNILDSLPDENAEFPCQLSPGSCFEIILAAGLGGLEKPDPKPDPNAGVDASIQVRSSSNPVDNRVVTLKKGVVLVDTQVGIALQEKTSDSFSGLEPMLGQAIEGAAVSILGEPGDPAVVNAEDRVLAILEGSNVHPANQTVTTALVAVLDGTLRGPTAPSIIGKDAAGVDILRKEVSPIIEMFEGSAEVTTGVMVGSTATIGQTDILDQALLEASSPLLAMIQSTLTTASDFGRVAGQNAQLKANLLPGDALVRLQASTLMVNGNLFNVTGGAKFIVNGDVLSVGGTTSVFINNGVFVAVGAEASFSLNGALVNFGTGINKVNVTNSLCAGGGCFSPFANPNWKVAGNPADFSAAKGFNPFVDLGTFSDRSVNTLNVGSDAAVLSVEPGGSIKLQ